MNPGLQIRVERLATDQRTLIEQLHIVIPAGCIHTLMGPSGCGKSTLLAAVCGTLDAALEFDGAVLLDGQPVHNLAPQLRRIGILFQDDLLFAHMNVLENLLFALPRGARAQRAASALQALEDVEMQDFLHADPATLSGGQRARVALARALLAQPRALLLDEPFSRLDTSLRQRMRTLVFQLVARRNIPALLVTHDMDDVADPQRLTVWSP
ncbi:MAG: ATP-binding cassette domain-containing protein [Rhodoferax sp.]|nr:MAG: ATP-binding cassette domain-containing protein [Rhodoferax sp.]